LETATLRDLRTQAGVTRHGPPKPSERARRDATFSLLVLAAKSFAEPTERALRSVERAGSEAPAAPAEPADPPP
jgi:hypothetical protein